MTTYVMIIRAYSPQLSFPTIDSTSSRQSVSERFGLVWPSYHSARPYEKPGYPARWARLGKRMAFWDIDTQRPIIYAQRSLIDAQHALAEAWRDIICARGTIIGVRSAIIGALGMKVERWALKIDANTPQCGPECRGYPC